MAWPGPGWSRLDAQRSRSAPFTASFLRAAMAAAP